MIVYICAHDNSIIFEISDVSQATATAEAQIRTESFSSWEQSSWNMSSPATKRETLELQESCEFEGVQ